MKLIASPTSPYARKVRAVLLEKNIDCAVDFDVPWNADTKIPQYNPLGKIPVLVLEDGSTIFDSRVIVEYLEGVKPQPPLIPQEFAARIAVKRWEALADGMSDAAATAYLEKKRAANLQSLDWINRQEQKISRGLDAANKQLGDHDWCVQDLSIADFALASALGYLDLRYPELKWRDNYPKLKTWGEKIFSRASLQQTLPPA